SPNLGSLCSALPEDHEQSERNKQMTEQQNTLQQQVIARAMKDEAFRQQLLSNPKETLQSKLGITLPVGVSVHVHENTPTNLHLVLPAKTQTGEPPVKF